MTAATEPARASFLEMRGISKQFPGVHALDGVDFDLRAGEVHAIVGENGAGKSTLMKILGGVYQPDAGAITLLGKPVTIQNPRHAQTLGIGIVHQELNLFPVLTVAENVLVGRQPADGPLRFVNWPDSYTATREYLRLFDLDVDPSAPLQDLSIAQQQVVEIARALSQQACVLILDEPTSALTEHETTLLFRTIRRLRDEGLGIVYISHRLDEVFAISDRITVLRDGQRVGTVDTGQSDVPSLIRMMVGRQLSDLYGHSAGSTAGEALRVEGLSSRGHFAEISFALQRGEILGFAGLIGAGRTEVARSIFGALARDAGAIYLEGREVRINSPKDAMRLGIAYLSENRRRDELFLGMDVRENISVTHLKRFSVFGFVRRGREAAEANSYVDQLRIQTPGLDQRVRNLSGGNQQKVVLARWLAIRPKVLIVDEPTRGIDVGAKAEIYALLHHLAAEGVAILLISSEMPEILGLSDRIIVMHEGRITGEMARAEATEERIMTYAAGQAVALATGEGRS